MLHLGGTTSLVHRQIQTLSPLRAGHKALARRNNTVLRSVVFRRQFRKWIYSPSYSLETSSFTTATRLHPETWCIRCNATSDEIRRVHRAGHKCQQGWHIWRCQPESGQVSTQNVGQNAVTTRTEGILKSQTTVLPSNPRGDRCRGRRAWGVRVPDLFVLHITFIHWAVGVCWTKYRH